MIEPDTRSRSARDRDDWIEEGRAVGQECREAADRTSSSAWKLGDWSNAHDRSYGDLRRAVEEGEIGVGYEYVKLCAHVARRIAPERRRAGLSFGHHQAVAGLEAEDGDRLLAQAELQDWSRDEMRLAVREASPEAALKRQAEKLKAENERLKRACDAPEGEAAATLVADTQHANEADAKEVRRLLDRMATRVEGANYIAAKNALHGNAARGAERNEEKLVACLVQGVRDMGQRIIRARTGDDGAADGYAGPNKEGAAHASDTTPDAPRDGYAGPNGAHPPDTASVQTGGAP